MNRVLEVLAQVTEKVHLTKIQSQEKCARVHYCPICDEKHY